MRVKTDHQVVPFGNDLMGLFDNDGTLLVQAARVEGGWRVTAEGVDRTVADRTAAVTELTQVVLEILPGEGFSTFVPRSINELP